MRNFLTRILLASAAALVAFALASTAHGQQADEDRTPVTPHPSQATTPPQPPKHDASAPRSDDSQTQEVLSFTGRVIKEQGQLVLHDPVTKMSYQFDDPAKAKQYLGRQVRVTGRLAMKSNTIHVEGIEPLS